MPAINFIIVLEIERSYEENPAGQNDQTNK